MKGSDHHRARNRLRLGIGLFILALAVPSLLLVHKAYDQMKWESFRQQQLIAEDLADRIDQSLTRLILAEDARPIEDYGFLVSSGDPGTPYTRRSPLADLPVGATIPGLIGWFEVAPDGSFSSPLVPDSGVSPADYGVDPADLAMRQARAQQIQGILVGNRLVERGTRELAPEVAAPLPAAPAVGGSGPRLASDRLGAVADLEAPRASANMAESREQAARPKLETDPRLSQAAFERLAAKEAEPRLEALKARRPARTEELKLDEDLAVRSQRQRSGRLDKGGLVETETSDAVSAAIAPADEIRIEKQTAPQRERKAVQLFENAVEPFEVGLLDSGHLLLFRSVWRGGERIIQGALIAQAPFLEALIAQPLGSTVLARTTHLIVAYRGEVLASFRAEPQGDYRLGSTPLRSGPPPLSGALLYRTRMQEPFGGLELIYSVSRLPLPPGAGVIGWMAAALALVLLAGGWLMYRLGCSQLALVRQQQDFVSAVSHELKTPLTSIRMYAEMLRAGFATEERKATYYRFIHEESERLSRLIANVLQLARIGRDALVLEPRPMTIRELMAMVQERVASQVERAGFTLRMRCDLEAEILADPDAFVQILINLVDNALKFTARAPIRRVEIGCDLTEGGWVRIGVRDFGPGIPKDQRQRIFELFYRGTEAKTEAISGTGIGLALVQRLTKAMGGRIEVSQRDPGAEFRIEIPSTKASPRRRPRLETQRLETQRLETQRSETQPPETRPKA
ncbi:sensor histidine kinase [Thiocystis violacea]|uniref:sensor histidine kinase n=1 Tax=Thiocystis violacea TaxID=13725 RepID=UPI0019083EF2|nr:HAMP domain-containing sensor histidine kinase [Thiocystis violacea]MBK1723704.1 two-component sensor histidine kinase [Thiocystis violacea]